MNEKYSLKIIQQGKTQQVRTVQNGAGMAGQAVVIQATDAARFQLVNVVTLVSPTKLQLKRVGDALHLVLPGGDIEAPDLVIQDYFKVKGASLQGSSISGEWMNYDTANLVTNPAPSVAGTDTLSSSVIDKTSNVSLGGEGVLGTFTEHPWLWAGGIAGAAAAGGGGGGGGSTPASDTSPLGIIQAYSNATAGAGVTAPTLATYKSAGVKALANLNETTASADIDSTAVATAMGTTWLAAINSAVDKRTDGSTLTVAQLQALADSYYRILSEADGVVNTSTDTIVYPSTGISNPTATDYINIGATVGNAKSVDLLNDFVGLSLKTAVDTVDEINTVAAAAYNVILKAGVAAGTGNLPAAYTLDSEWITGLTALGIVGVNANNIVAVKAAIAATATTGTANDGVEVDTVLEIKDLVKGAIALQVMVDYTNTNGTSAAPSLTTYTDAGIKAFASLTDTLGADRVALSASNADINALNSALDKLTGSSLTLNTTTDGTVQKMVDSYYRILKEADGSTTTNTDVYADTTNDATNAASYNDPTATDYANVGVTKVDGTALTVVSTTNSEIVALLNDAVGRFSTTSVDTVAELSALEKAAENIMAIGAGTGTGLATTGVTYTTDAEWIAGFTALGVTGVTTANLAAVKKAIDAADVGTALIPAGTPIDTVQELLDLVKPVIALQVLVDYTNTNGTSAAPSLTTYTDAGIKAFASLTDTLGADRVALSASNADINALNSALDKLTGSSLTLNTTTDGTVQKMVDSYYRILKEADGSTTTNTDVYADTTNDATNAASYNDPTATDYANVGVTKVDGTALTVVSTTNSEIVALLNDAVGRFSTTSVDTVAELSALEKAAENIMEIGAGTGTGLATTGVTYTTDAEWIAGFTALGVTGVTTANLAAVKKAIDAADVGTALIPAGTPIDTVQELLDLVKPVIALQVLVDYTNTNGTSAAPSLTTYTDAGIKAFASLTDTLGADRVALSASNADINALNSALDKLTGSSLTLNTTTDGTVQKMVDSYYRILKEADGKYIGDANGSTAYYDGSTVAKTADTDVYADTTNDATNAAAYNDPTATDYANIGVTKINATALTVASAVNTEILTLLNNAVGRFNTTKVDTIAELSALETAAENVFALSSGGALGTVSYTGATADADWAAGLTALGVTGVTTSNITAVKAAIDAKDNSNDGTAVDTVAELQAVVSLARMVAFTNDGAAIGSKVAATPTLADWGALVNVNTSLFDATLINLDVSTYWKSNPTNGVNALNSALDTYAGLSLNTAAPLKTIADSYGRVLQEADGSRTNNTDVSKVDGSANTDLVVADLTNLGVTFLNTAGTVIPANTVATLAAEKNLLLDAIGGLFNTAVDTVTELNDLAKIADNVVKQAAGGTVTYLDSEWVSALSSLSITGANTTNIATIKTNIAATADVGSGVDSYNELQSIVSLVRVNDYAALNTGYVLPTIEDYQALVATSGTAGDVTTYGLTAISTSNAGGAFVAYSNANSSYLSSYNDAVNSKPSGAFTGIEVKNLVLAYNSILAEANGTTSDQTTYDPLGSDYLAVGVGSGTSIDTNITTMLNVTEYATLLTDVIANKTTTQVDQVSELNALASIIVKIQDLEGKMATGGVNYTAITGGALQVSELASLGLDTSNLTNTSYSGSVLVNRLNNVYDNIIAVDHTSSGSRATLDSLAEMQALINNTSGIVI